MKRTCILVWACLMMLLALTLGSSYIPMGPWNTAVNSAISCGKMLLIALFFMHLKASGALLRIVAVAGLVWLAILFGLSSTDYATRPQVPAAWSAPR